MIKQIFDSKQGTITYSTTGRALICVNEKEIVTTVQVPSENPEEGDTEETKELIQYEYDTQWITPVKQSTEAALQAFKNARIEEIAEYGNSSAVNIFTLNGMKLWLDYATRGRLKNRLLAEQEDGKEESTIWYSGYSIKVPVEKGLYLLSKLEVYASESYDITSQHKVDIQALDTIEAVANFDITADYPEPPVFTM